MHKTSRPLFWSSAVFATRCGAAALTWFILTTSQQADIASRFDALTQRVVEQIKQRLTLLGRGK
ncbi:hypothetical protein P3G55_24880 [Leptospira sp. 96542]|nr:hypothetical protein [Leptospira sp. 96542]